MPRLVYIICSESTAVDKNNRISHGQVIESVEVMRADVSHASQIPKRPFVFEITAVFMREDNEGDGPFEFDFRLRVGEQYLERSGAPFGQFIFSRRVRFHRLTVKGEIGHFPAPGILEMECWVRPVGGDDHSWKIHSYPILLIEKTPALVSEQIPVAEQPSS